MLDLTFAIAGLLLASPVMALLWLAVRMAHGRPVLFRQRRVGRGGFEFTMPKFRSMREAFDQEGRPLPDEMRVTPLGRFLRRSRLDELPGLAAILRGHMAVVGPRPLPADVLRDVPRARERTLVRPGLTGLAQVSGNTLLNPVEKIALDLLYVRTRSILLDLQIIVRTVAVILFGEKRDEAAIRRALEAFADGAMPAEPGRAGAI